MVRIKTVLKQAIHYDMIERIIRERSWFLMSQKHATVREIAKTAGVSPSTAFRALGGEGAVSEAAKNKVLAAKQFIEGRHFADNMESHENRSVGIIMPTATAQDIGRHPTMFVTVTNFISVLSSIGISNSILVFDENPTTLFGFLTEKKNGYLIIGTSEEQEKSLIPLLSEAGVPAVTVNRQVDAPYISCVNIDDASACFHATQHLIDLGHERIAFLGGKRNYQNTKRRIQGYQKAMEAAGLLIPEEYCLTGDYTESSGFEMADTLLHLPNRPTAVVCASDTIAIGCIHTMNQAGLNIPNDISVIGFGDIEAGRTMNPPLTTVSQSSEEYGTVAAHMLLQSMDMPVILSQKVLLQTRLIIRGSTASPNPKIK